MPEPILGVIIDESLPPAGRRRLERQLQWLRSGGAGRAVVCLAAPAPALRRQLDGSRVGLPLGFRIEEEPLGSAGAVRALGPASLPEDIVVLSGGYLPKEGLRRLLSFHESHSALATLAVHRCAHEPACQPVVLGAGEAVLDLPARPLVGRYPLGLSPAWILRRPLLKGVPEKGPTDLVRDVFPAALRRGSPLAGCLVEDGA